MTVRLFVVAVGDPAEVDVAADELWRLGVSAIEELAVDDRIELRTVLGEAELADATEQLAGRFDVRIDEVDGRPGEQWRDHARPVVVSERLVIAPAWWTEHQRGDELRSDASEAVAVRIEPAAAFGLGDHPTTRATLALLDDALRHRTAPAVLDVGSGTGVLGIAALLLGADSVRAIDVSGAAVDATLDNARRNGVADRLIADQTELALLDGAYDVLVANLLAPLLVDLAGHLIDRLTAQGVVIISGLLESQEPRVVQAFAPLVVTGRVRIDGWLALELSR